jgi:hypothetical protein
MPSSVKETAGLPVVPGGGVAAKVRTTRDTSAEAERPRVSETVALTAYVPVAEGWHERTLEFAEAHPGGSPAYE